MGSLPSRAHGGSVDVAAAAERDEASALLEAELCGETGGRGDEQYEAHVFNHQCCGRPRSELNWAHLRGG